MVKPEHKKNQTTSKTRCFDQKVIDGNKAVVHIVIKTTGKAHKSEDWIFNQKKRTELIEQFYLYSKLSPGLSILSLTAMSTHLHAQILIDYSYKPSRTEITEAYFNIYQRQLHPNSSEVYKLCQTASDLSKFMQRFCHDFAWKFNRQCNFKRTGHLWSERFHSTLLTDAKSLLKCWLYIMFNPVKAGMVDNPLACKFNSLTFKSKAFCEECMQNLFAAYQDLLDHDQMNIDEFKALLFELLKEEVKKWQCLSQIRQAEYKSEHHFWDQAYMVGCQKALNKSKEKLRFRHSPHETNESGQFWI